MYERHYEDSVEVALKQKNYALCELLAGTTYPKRASVAEAALVRALRACDDEESPKLLDAFSAATVDGFVEPLLVSIKGDSSGKLTIKDEMLPGYSYVIRDITKFYEHKHDEVARRLINLYRCHVPLVQFVDGRAQVSQDESESIRLKVGCLKKSKEKIFDELVVYWASTRDEALSLLIIKFFAELPFQMGDEVRGDNGKVRDRELCLDAIRNNSKLVDAFRLTKQAKELGTKTVNLGTNDADRHYVDVLRLLLVGIARNEKDVSRLIAKL